MESKTLFDDVKALNIPFGNWSSDLYIPCNNQTRELLKQHGVNATAFRNNVEGGIWFDCPFQFTPFWQNR